MWLPVADFKREGRGKASEARKAPSPPPGEMELSEGPSRTAATHPAVNTCPLQQDGNESPLRQASTFSGYRRSQSYYEVPFNHLRLNGLKCLSWFNLEPMPTIDPTLCRAVWPVPGAAADRGQAVWPTPALPLQAAPGLSFPPTQGRPDHQLPSLSQVPLDSGEHKALHKPC